ncbi:UNVERIFIED_CONTAM: hypothetical protein RMT77_008552 [Armadillidium vulgare]
MLATNFVFDLQKTGFTPLMYAAKDNRNQFIDRLVDLGCDPNAQNKEGWGAIHLAVMYAREETIRALVHKKADVNATGGPFKQTVSHIICERSGGPKQKVPTTKSTQPTRDQSAISNDARDYTAAHLVAGRSSGAALALLKVVLMYGKPDLRLTKDKVKLKIYLKKYLRVDIRKEIEIES